MNENKHFKQRAIKKLKDHQFIVEDYQRGYKWNYNQVLDLLNDISQFDIAGNLQSYCLQPVAVKKIDVKDKLIYELVDGQQRLTTIYIILRLISDEKIFRITYKTRKSSELFINEIHTLKSTVNHFELYDENNIQKQFRVINNELNELWTKYLENNASFDNVDNFHFFRAACIISGFFRGSKKEQSSFLTKLKNKVKIIWYEDVTNKTANELFKNLNSGKIRLSSADLIKALFILNIEEKGKLDKLPSQIEFEQNKLASEWDTIEQQLHEPKFWSFIIGNVKRDYKDSRIGYLFEVLTNSIEHSYSYQSYREYENGNTPLEWDDVIALFFTLKEWYNDVYIYHRIGFLMRQSIKGWSNLMHIYKHYKKSKTKVDFKSNILNTEVKNHFQTSKIIKNDSGENIKIYNYDLELIRYDENLKGVRNLLVFLNVLTYETVMPNYRIDFDEFYNDKWTVEHIYPQNPKTMVFSECETYFEEIKNSLNSKSNSELSKNEQEEIYLLLKQIKAFESESESVVENKEKEFINKLSTWISDSLTDLFQLHNIGNLTLLTQEVNSSIGNKPFSEKRKIIVDIFKNEYRKKSFIPLSTLQIFTKSYSTESPQFKFWSPADADDYRTSIGTQMNEYLPQTKGK